MLFFSPPLPHQTCNTVKFNPRARKPFANNTYLSGYLHYILFLNLSLYPCNNKRIMWFFPFFLGIQKTVTGWQEISKSQCKNYYENCTRLTNFIYLNHTKKKIVAQKTQRKLQVKNTADWIHNIYIYNTIMIINGRWMYKQWKTNILNFEYQQGI